MLDNQSKTVKVSQLPEAQAPLLLHPGWTPFIVDEQLLQLIIFLEFQALRPLTGRASNYVVNIGINTKLKRWNKQLRASVSFDADDLYRTGFSRLIGLFENAFIRRFQGVKSLFVCGVEKH